MSTTPDQVMAQHLDKFREQLWSESDPSSAEAAIFSTSVEKPNVYNSDDAMFRWITGQYSINAYLIITKTAAHVILPDSRTQEKFDNLKSPGKVFIKVLSGSIIDEVNSITTGTLAAMETTVNNGTLDGISFIDQTALLEHILVIHFDNELSRIRNAARVADRALTSVFKPLMESCIEADEDKTPLKDLSKMTLSDLNNPEKINSKLNRADVEPAFMPAIQCGRNADVKFPMKTGDGSLTIDIVCVQIGVRFKSYVAAVGRTYLINSTDTVKTAYKSLVKARDEAIAACTVDNTFGAVYRAFVNALEPNLRQFVPDTLGSYCGTMVTTESYPITKDSTEVIKPSSTIILTAILKNISLPGEPPFSLQLVDTVQVTDQTNAITSAKSKFKLIAYKFENSKQDMIAALLADNRPMTERTRNATEKKVDQAAGVREMFKDFERTTTRKVFDEEDLSELREENSPAYTSPSELPSFPTPTMIQTVDKKMCVFFPMSGVLVPFHISTIKTVKDTTAPSGESSSISVSFNLPSKDKETKSYFVKELVYTAPGNNMFGDVASRIKKMIARYKALQKKKKEQSEMYVSREEFKSLHKTGKPIPLIRNVHLRPPMSGKKSIGTLEAHINGFSYRSQNGDKLEVMYRNVKLAIFQPSDNELITLLHLYLNKPIKVGSKAEQHITFYRQVVDNAIDTSKTHNGMTDQAELAEEEHDRKVRKKYNKEFKRFTKEILDPELGLENPPRFEKPKKQLGFQGVTAKQSVYIYPMPNCLISVVDAPPFVLMVDDVDVAVFERETLSVKYFDLTFILKDFDKDPVSILNIGAEYSPIIKEWLNAINIRYFSSESNFEWKTLMPMIKKQGREQFYEDGGWDGFFADEDDEQESDSSEEFKAGDDEDVEYEDDDDDDEEFPDEDDEDEDDDIPEETDSEDAERSWQELEREAERRDRKAERREAGEHHHHHHRRH